MKRVLRRALLLLLTTMGAILGGILADARFSGWSDLAKDFRSGAPGRDLQISIQRGGLGLPRWYHRVAPLEAAIGFSGLRLSYPFPYSVGHPPLQIPWGELRVEAVVASGETGSRVVLAVSSPTRARVTLHGDLATVVQEWLSPRG